MESLVNDSSVSPTKQAKNSRKKSHRLRHQHQHQVARLPHISRQSSCGAMYQKFAPSPHVQREMVHDTIAGGVFFNHFPKQYYLPFPQPPIILPSYYQNHQPKINPQHQQPPLLPHPVVSQPALRTLPPPQSRDHSLSAPLTRGHSLSSAIPKKPPNKTKLNLTAAAVATAATTTKTTTQSKKKEWVKESEATTKEKKNDGSSLIEYNQDAGPAKEVERPNPGTPPKEVPRVLPAVYRESEVVEERKEKNFTAASLFSLAPPPSSLPLPKFPLRRLQLNKLSCNAEAAAAEVDNGATDSIRRLLKLR